MKCLAFLCCLFLTLSLGSSESDSGLDAGGDDGGGSGSSGSFQFEGKILPPDNKPQDWYWSTRILIDGGKRVAFIKVIKVCFLAVLPSQRRNVSRQGPKAQNLAPVLQGLSSVSNMLKFSKGSTSGLTR